MKSRAVVAWEAGKPLVIEEVEVAAPKAGEVLLKIAATTLPGITSSTAAPAVSGLGLAIEVNVEDGNFAAGSASGFNYFIVGPRILFGSDRSSNFSCRDLFEVEMSADLRLPTVNLAILLEAEKKCRWRNSASRNQ